jgi:calcineurin-like phosphoesterase family protein
LPGRRVVVLLVRLAVVGTLLALTPLDAAPPAVRVLSTAPQSPTARRIVAVGDVHGSAGGLTAILARAGLIDAKQRWTGGKTTFVQTGDLMDRGAGVRTALDLLMALEPQAAAAGGRVQVLLGNHEVMNLLADTRDATPEIFHSFADGDSESRRERAFQAASRLSPGAGLDKAAWLAAHPIGYVEYRDALKPNGRYGRWLRSKPILAEIDGIVFMHAGVNAEFSTESLDDISRRARRELAAWDEGVRWVEQQKLVLPFSTIVEILEAARAQLTQFSAYQKEGTLTEDHIRAARLLLPLTEVGASSLLHPDGPLWFRGFSAWTDEQGAPRMAALLQKLRVTRFVTGHTPQPSGRITNRFGGALFLIDTGMLGGKFYPGGRASALEIVGDTVKAIYEDGIQSLIPNP